MCTEYLYSIAPRCVKIETRRKILERAEELEKYTSIRLVVVVEASVVSWKYIVRIVCGSGYTAVDGLKTTCTRPNDAIRPTPGEGVGNPSTGPRNHLAAIQSANAVHVYIGVHHILDGCLALEFMVTNLSPSENLLPHRTCAVCGYTLRACVHNIFIFICFLMTMGENSTLFTI
jgi:hypothetical protein